MPVLFEVMDNLSKPVIYSGYLLVRMEVNHNGIFHYEDQ